MQMQLQMDYHNLRMVGFGLLSKYPLFSSLTPLTLTHNPHIDWTIHLNMGASTHICEHNKPVFTPIDLKTCIANYTH